MVSATQILLIVVWLGFDLILFLLALIARFYEMNSGKRTYYWFYTTPFILYTLATALYIDLNTWGGSSLADGLMFLAGSSLIGLTLRLYRQMTRSRS